MTLHTIDCFTDADICDESDTAPVSAMWARFAAPPIFSAVEERVMALAASDGLASLDAPGVLARLSALLFGGQAGGHRLADPRLEGLRCAIVVARHRHHLPDAEAARLRALGFVEVQISGIEARATRR